MLTASWDEWNPHRTPRACVFDQIARLLVTHRNLLVARMQITPYNLYVLGSLSSEPWLL